MSKIKRWEQIPNEARPKLRYWVPGAEMDPKDLVRDIQEIRKRGYGGIEMVSLQRQAQPGTEWGTENWKQLVDVAAGTTESLGMTLDLANGPAWPIAMPQIQSADDPAALMELTYGEIHLKDGLYSGPLPERQKKREEGSPELIACMAYQEAEDHVLIPESYVDLIKKIHNDTIEVQLEGENWILFAFYQQPAVHKVEGCYVIDHFSAAGAQACIDYWDPIFKENPQPSLESLFCDSLEYDVEMEWSRIMTAEFERICGYSILPYLPVCGLTGTYPENAIPGYTYTDRAMAEAVNHDYLEVVTQCHCEQHLAVLENWAAGYGKSIRYQVCYNKVMEVERAGLYVGIPENEALGRSSMDHLKTMAAAAKLGRKRRHSFECAAEFGNGYGQSYDDLLWWVKRSLMAGMNAQVLHGGSYSGRYQGKLQGDWPGYEGFGLKGAVSNNWNRTPDVDHARGCIDAITRMNAVFQLQGKVDAAVLRNEYLNNGWGGDGTHLYPDGGALMHAGYSYEFLSPALLKHPNCKVTDRRLDMEGAAYKVLLIPQVKAIGLETLESIRTLLMAQFPVVWIGEKPQHMMYYHEAAQSARWEMLLEEVWDQCYHADTLIMVPELLQTLKILPDMAVQSKVPVMTAHHVQGTEDFYILYHYNLLEYAPEKAALSGPSDIFAKDTQMPFYDRGGEETAADVEVTIAGSGSLWRCDPWSGQTEPIPCTEQEGYLRAKVTLREDEMVILRQEIQEEKVCSTETVETVDISLSKLVMEPFAPERLENTPIWDCSYGEAQEYSITGPQAYTGETWSGRGTYTGNFAGEAEGRWILQLPEVCDTFTVKVNGMETAFPDQVMKRVEITDCVREGDNEIAITVVTNLYNDLVRPDAKYPFPYWQKTYGMWETETKKLQLKHYK